MQRLEVRKSGQVKVLDVTTDERFCFKFPLGEKPHSTNAELRFLKWINSCSSGNVRK